jgi:hypothetical protein
MCQRRWGRVISWRGVRPVAVHVLQIFYEGGLSMIKNSILILSVLVVAFAFSRSAFAQEFPIATGSDITFGGGGASDGTNVLIAIMGDASSQYSITCQFISSSGTLVGSRISLGATGSSPMVAYDGTRYLIAWTEAASMLGGSDIFAISVQIVPLSGRETEEY